MVKFGCSASSLRARRGGADENAPLFKHLPAFRSLFLGIRSLEIHQGHIRGLRWLWVTGRCRFRRPGSRPSTLGIGGGGGPSAHTRPDIRLHAKACPAEHGGATGPGEAALRPLLAPSPGRCPERGLRTTPFPQRHKPAQRAATADSRPRHRLLLPPAAASSS